MVRQINGTRGKSWRGKYQDSWAGRARWPGTGGFFPVRDSPRLVSLQSVSRSPSCGLAQPQLTPRDFFHWAATKLWPCKGRPNTTAVILHFARVNSILLVRSSMESSESPLQGNTTKIAIRRWEVSWNGQIEWQGELFTKNHSKGAYWEKKFQRWSHTLRDTFNTSRSDSPEGAGPQIEGERDVFLTEGRW